MPEIDLDQTYIYSGTRYGPGLVTVPDELAIALGITSQTSTPTEQANEGETSNEAHEQAKSQAEKTEGKLLINIASAETIADRLSGVGLNTAKKVVALRESLPSHKLDLEALKSIPRADWDALASEIDFVQ